jgi:glycosyltransferase involved in cell wall biosynthesis
MSAPGGLKRVCLTPRLKGVGGMVSFQHRLAAGLAQQGIEACFDLNDRPYEAVLVVGGTRDLAGLWRVRGSGIPVIQRLDGRNWLHRLPAKGGKSRASVRHFIRSEYGNWLLGLIRARFADRVIYQSEFSKAWWERSAGPTRIPNRVIYNGVDLLTFSPDGPQRPSDDLYRLVLVEGSLMGGYEQGLETALDLAAEIQRRLTGGDALRAGIELMIVGRVAPAVQAAAEKRALVPLKWAGLAPRERIPEFDRSAHLLYSADLNPACPNSVIEALACGLPVVAFDTGALPELVDASCGRIVPYGGDPWELDRPDTPALADAAVDALLEQDSLREGARRRAMEQFGIERVVEQYVQVLRGQL